MKVFKDDDGNVTYTDILFAILFFVVIWSIVVGGLIMTVNKLRPPQNETTLRN